MATRTSTSTSKSTKKSSTPSILDTYNRRLHMTQWETTSNRRQDLAVLATEWFEQNPPSAKNMTTWGTLLAQHISNLPDIDNVAFTKPIADYLRFIATIDKENLFAPMPSSTIGQSSRYDNFCEVVGQLASTEVYAPNVAMARLATNAMVDFDALMRNLKSMREKQIHYADYVLDNGAEFKDLPELLLMRSLMSLSFDGKWNIPQDNPTYHDMWELIDTIDATLTSPEYSPRKDIVAHLAKELPGSMHEALEFFQYFGDKLQPIQQQHIFGMSLASLEWPQGVEKLLDAVYFNDSHDTASAIALFEAINPATKVMNMYMTLYDGYTDLVNNIPSLTTLREVFMGEDAQRDKGKADELVKEMGYQAGEFQEHEW